MEFIDRQKRYSQMLAVMARHDLSFVLDRTGLSKLVPRESKATADDDAGPLSMPERVRRVFEELGPTFVKMGQILSTRPDLLPQDYIVEFKKLQDDVAALPYEEIARVAEDDLGQPLDEVFATVDPEPLAAASIGQVHRVTLQDGTAAVVKVQRPGIENTIRQDLSILRSFAQLARSSGLLGTIDPVAIVVEFERTILRELDYVTEGHATDDFRAQHADDEGLLIPQVYWDHSTRRVLTLEYVDGIKVSEIRRLRDSGHDLARVAHKLLEVILSQVFVRGMFHADPHPGNLLVVADGRLAMIDFGMAGRFDRYTRRALMDLLRDLADRDYRRMADHLLQHELIDYGTDLRQVRADLRDMFRAASSGAMGDQVQVLMDFVVRHEVAFPPDLFFLDKVFGTLDGAVRTLDPKLDAKTMARTFLPQLASAQVTDPQGMLRQLAGRIMEAEDTLLQLPVDLDKVLRRLDAGHLRVRSEWTPSADGRKAAARLMIGAGGMALGLFGLVAWLVLTAADADVALAGVSAARIWLVVGCAALTVSAAGLWRM